MVETLRAAIIGCGRMGGTIDDEVAGYPAIVLPYSHAATYAAVDGVALGALADVDRCAAGSGAGPVRRSPDESRDRQLPS